MNEVRTESPVETVAQEPKPSGAHPSGTRHHSAA